VHIARIAILGEAMFDTIILLASAAEQVALGSALRDHNPRLSVYPVTKPEDLAAFDATALPRARLIAFSSPMIVPSDVLSSLGYGAYNFHPGSPQFPGWAPVHFALYEQATEFGVTVHAMAEQVDSGPIIDVALFAVPADIGVVGLEGLAYAHLARMFWQLAKRLTTDAAPLPARALQWGDKRNSRRAYQAICDIPLDISKDELDRRMRVFGGNHYGVTPTIRLHGVEFRAVGAGAMI
jgi:methionyl-tRNA formyltransferase